jgi:hypothetical protein
VTTGHRAPGPEPGPAAGSWRDAGPELAAAVVFLVASAAVAYFIAGLAAMVLAVVAWSALALCVLTLVSRQARPSALRREPAGDGPGTGDWEQGYWRFQAQIAEATKSAYAYHFGVGPQLEHLLAARLSQRHGVNLYTDPGTARRLLCARRRDRDLWAWVDPQRNGPGRNAAGIPPRALARLVKRLEKL